MEPFRLVDQARAINRAATGITAKVGPRRGVGTRGVILLGLLAALEGLGACSSVPPQASLEPTAPKATAKRCEQGGGFSAPDDQGVLTRVPDGQAHVTVLELWARWCQPCASVVPALLARRAEIEAGGGRIVLLGVLEDAETIDDARATLASWGVYEPFMIDRGGALMRKLGVRELPASAVLDQAGNLRWVSEPGAGGVTETVQAAQQAKEQTCPP